MHIANPNLNTNIPLVDELLIVLSVKRQLFITKFRLVEIESVDAPAQQRKQKYSKD